MTVFLIPIILGLTQDITYPTYRAFDKIRDMVNLVPKSPASVMTTPFEGHTMTFYERRRLRSVRSFRSCARPRFARSLPKHRRAVLRGCPENLPTMSGAIFVSKMVPLCAACKKHMLDVKGGLSQIFP